MNKSFKIFLFSLAAVIAFIIVIDSMRVKPVSWKPTYSLDKKNPLDLYVLNKEIDTLFSTRRVERINTTFYEYIDKNKDIPRNYLIINQQAAYNRYLDTIMLKTVSNGSNLFISAEIIMQGFLDTLKVKTSYVDINKNLLKKDSSNLLLTSDGWKNVVYTHSTSVNSFVYLGLNPSKTTILGEIKFPTDTILYPNFIKIKYGKGTIFLHNQPSVFTNFALLQKNSAADYVSRVLSYIPKNLPTVWLVKGQTDKSIQDAQRTTLSVVLRYPALRMMWYIFLVGLLLFIIFNAKRRQRIVPIIKPLRNTTVEFTQTIGNLYFQENDAINIMKKKIAYFLDKIRNRYYLDTHVLDEKFEEKLNMKSGKDKELINKIVGKIRQFQKNSFAENEDLVELNSLMEKFWEE